MLARGRKEGLGLITAEPSAESQVAIRSFWAAAVCLPAFVCLHVLEWVQSGVPDHPAGGFALALLGFIIDWAAFAVLSHYMASGIGRGRQWPRYIAIWNWCNVVQYLMLTAAALPVLLGLPDWVEQAAWLIAMGWALWLEWYATRLALEVGPFAAAGLTLFDLILGLFVFGFTAAIN